MAASLASQLQAIKSIVQADSEPLKRPFTRPSILFSPKEAADIDIDAIYDIALTGLEVLVKTDERFRSYRNDLFSHRSKELDRELMGAEENDRINLSITSYLRLLSGYFQCPSGLKTLEYLIRRYKIHAYNMEELILCALPYHDTHGFVRIVQLLNFGNTKWKFLEGVKVSGAPPPRQILVQQCIRDMGVLEVLCSYASPSKKFQPSSTVVSFCTAVVVEVVGCLATVDSDVVKRILPFVVSTIQSGVKGGSECKASALMIVSLLAKKAALSPKLVKSLIRSIAEIAQEYKKDAMELQWVRLSFMALVNLVQSQLVDVFPKKVVHVMKEIRDITGILAQLSSDFIVDKFLALLLESLVEYSFSDASCRFLLLSIIEKVPIGNVVDHLISKVLFSCMKLSQKIDDSLSESGLWARKILVGIMKSYPSELHVAVRKFLENPRLHSGKQEPVIETLSRVLDGNFGSSLPMLDSKIWFSLHHPKAEVRCAALSSLNVPGVLKANMDRLQGLETIHDAILQQLHDNDLSVVRAALSVNELPDLVNDNDFLQVLRAIMRRCVGILVSGSSNNILLAGDTFMLCSKFFITRSQGSLDLSKALAALIFPLLLTMPKTQKYTLRVLELAKEVNWPLYQNLPIPPDSESKLQAGSISSINLSVVDSLADQFLKQPQEFLPFLVERSNDFIVSKTLFLLVLLQSIMMAKKGNRVLDLLEACLPVVQTQWETFKFDDDIHVEECNLETLGRDCIGFLDQLFDAKFEELNRKILLSIFWRFLGAFISTAPADSLPNEGVSWVGKLREIFILFARFNRRQLFREHLHYLVTNCKICPATYLSGFFTEEGLPVAVQVESLRSFEYLCVQSEDGLSFQLLAKFPSLLVPMASDNKDIRNAAMGCIEGLHTLCTHVGLFGKKNGTVALWSHFLDGLLTLIIQHKRLILSDRKFLASFLSALVVPSGAAENFLVPQDVRNRFSQSTKKEILDFILESALKLSSYGKLVILSLLRGTGEALMHVKDVEILLSKLLEIRDHCYFEMDSSCQRLSKTEVDILSLLLESCAKSSAGSFNFAHHLLKALHREAKAFSFINVTMILGVERREVKRVVDGSIFVHLIKESPLVCSFSNASPKKRLATLITVVFNGSMVGGSFSEDPAVVLPCITVLRKLNNQIYVGLTSEMQELLFLALVFLFRRGNAEIQNATKEVLLSLDVPGSTMAQMLSHLSQFEFPQTPQRKKRRSSSYCSHEQDVLSKGEDAFSFLSSVLDILLLKKDIANRESLLGPLFKLLGCVFSDKWIHGDIYLDGSPIQAVSAISGTATSELHHIQQKLLLVLEDIVASFADHMQNKGQMMDSINIKLLINCAHSAKDGVTCNHIFSLLSRITRVIPDRILNHMKDILTVAGEISLTQVDSDSQRVFEDLISSIVPCWLSKTNNVGPLLEVFVNVLPEVAEKRRLSAVIYLLRILGESSGLASLLFLLFRSLIARKSLLEPDSDEYNSLEFMGVIQMEWEYKFALQIFEHYPCRAWLPSIVMLLKQIGRESPNQVMFVELLFAMHFTSGKLQDPELAFALESRGDLENIQGMLEELMEQVVYLWQLIDSKRGSAAPAFVREGLKYHMNSVMTTTTMVMIPSSYFKGITKILDNADQSVKRKALSLLCKTMKHQGSLPLKRKEKREYSLTMHSNWLQLDEGALEAFDIMCMGIVQLLDMSEEDSNTSLKSAAVSALGVLANRFPSNRSMFNGCLNAVVGTIGSSDVALSSCSLQTAGTLISVLGAKALIHLPHLMENMMKLWGSISSGLNVESKVVENDASFKSSISRDLMLSVLIALEAVLDKLGGFLNPYLENICKFLVLHPDLALGSDVKLKSEADTTRKLIADKIPVRLALPPLVNLYSGAVAAGNPSLTIMFEMLTKMITTMDRASIAGYHTRIFDLCLSALDLRRQHNPSIKNINAVERSVINTMIGLTMKLTEGMFKPLFIRVIEWAESDVEGTPYIESRNLDRAISFYELVNKLAENHRSLFVPYFKYMLESCVRHLTDTVEGPSGLVQKKKKAKTSKIKFKEGNNELSLEKWHTRALVLSALHKCFLYDTGFSKFLDPSTFQVLLKPIVSQLVVEPPPSLEDHTDVPSVQEVDDLLVLCTGQMAVTAGSDLLCKPLNHEVLMQTRSEKVRPRILGLKIVKYLLKNLKEEYLVFLAETIPFLGELLEDIELPVKSLAQEILKEMESMSGESLRQYL